VQARNLIFVPVVLPAVLWMSGAIAQPQDAAAPAPPTIKTETRLVLVDTVVTDKKGQYIHDLTAKDFKVLEDNKEQTISSFSFEADPASPTNSRKRYLVLFFDNSTMGFGEQAQAREAAAKFIDANTGPNRLTAIVNFGGSLQIAQNFTADSDRLKKVVSGVKFSNVSSSDCGIRSWRSEVWPRTWRASRAVRFWCCSPAVSRSRPILCRK
jgi:VWFA-related protein